MTTRTDALADALERLDGYAYLDGPGFAVHGPMGAETLSALGHNDMVAGWVEAYKLRHQPIETPPPRHRSRPTMSRAGAPPWVTCPGSRTGPPCSGPSSTPVPGKPCSSAGCPYCSRGAAAH
jgi:hypothetical protein